jgi:hypothetical protein
MRIAVLGGSCINSRQHWCASGYNPAACFKAEENHVSVPAEIRIRLNNYRPQNSILRWDITCVNILSHIQLIWVPLKSCEIKLISINRVSMKSIPIVFLRKSEIHLSVILGLWNFLSNYNLICPLNCDTKRHADVYTLAVYAPKE